MKQIPESIKYGINFILLVSITLMTPFCAIVLEILLGKYSYQGIHSIMTVLISFIFLVLGLKLFFKNHKYIINKEIEYGLDDDD